MEPSKAKYEKYIGKYIKYEFTNCFGTYKFIKYGKITGIGLNKKVDQFWYGNDDDKHYFILDSEYIEFACQLSFGCGKTKRRITTGEYTLFTEEDTGYFDTYLINSIK